MGNVLASVISEEVEEHGSNLHSGKDPKNCNESGNYTHTEVRNYMKQEFKNSNDPPLQLKVTQSLNKIEDRNCNDTSSKQEVTNHHETPAESEVNNTKTSGKSTDEQKEKRNRRTTIDRLGVLARILIGLCEDFPVVLAVYYPTVMPMCGIPAKQNMRSGVSLATVISSMLNSLWTMICLFFELSGCTKPGVCCLATPRNKKFPDINGEDAEGKGFVTDKILRAMFKRNPPNPA